MIKKLGKKEDEYVVASDSALDAKLEVIIIHSLGSSDSKAPGFHSSEKKTYSKE